MPRPAETAPPDDAPRPGADDQTDDDAPAAGSVGSAPTGHAPEIDLSRLPVAGGITRRRVAFLAAAFVSAWIVVVFARQVGEASAAANRAEQMRLANVELAADVASLERELELIQRQEYILQQARGYRLGIPNEIPFSLSPDAPPLAADAPGSAAVRLGAGEPPVTPLESWLSLLFGPGR
jgi:cell division protein FtsB